MKRAEFHVEWQGETVKGWADGVDRSHLRKLRRGEWLPEFELDLHGLREHEAQALVLEFVEDALGEGARCISIIHGRGHRSERGPVLKQACVRWLSTGPARAHVLAFHSAPAVGGGGGATWVLLRRARGREKAPPG